MPGLSTRCNGTSGRPGFHRGLVDVIALLGCCTAWEGLSLTFRDSVSVPTSGIKKASLKSPLLAVSLVWLAGNMSALSGASFSL